MNGSAVGLVLASAFLAAVLAFWVFSIVDLVRSDSQNVQVFPREAWLAIIIFGSVVGCLAWWFLGRPRQT
ncbi:PLDc N-terminal domain-containing protein [Sinomonas atrocyanea]